MKPDDTRTLRIALILLSLALYVLRFQATHVVGFGDSEALYACYALHPAPAYLDHPGLIGALARAIGSGGLPSPYDAHSMTSLLVTAIPWFAFGTARSLGASERGAYLAALAIAVTPEMAIGLFAMTPDLPLAIAWLGALACAGAAIRAKEPSSLRTSALFVAVGLIAGIASTAKISGLLLMAALAWTYASNDATRRMRWPWLGLLCGAITFSPVVIFEAHSGFPMLRHRLIDTQTGAGVSLRNLGALLGGQFAYVSPLFVIAAIWIFLDLRKNRDEDEITRLLWRVTILPMIALGVLSLVSRVAEPHWIAPALLALPLHFARNYGEITRISSRFSRISMGLALAMVLFVHAWVLVPSLARYEPRSMDPKYDIANELFGWPDVATSAKELLGDQDSLEARINPVYVVGPHWVVCAQLQAALGPNVQVGCNTPIPDDFDDWLPRPKWQEADTILFVTDNRFDVDLEKTFPDRIVVKRARISIPRGGRIARTFSLVLLSQRAPS